MANTQTGTSAGTSARGSTTSGMQSGTGGHIPDTTYNLISVLYHTLQGCQTYEQYAQDAEQAGQQEVAQFFRKTGRELEQCAQEGKQLLVQCLQQGTSQGQGMGRAGQLNSQISGSSGQQSQSGTSSGQQASGRGSSNTGSSSSNMSGSGSSRGKP